MKNIALLLLLAVTGLALPETPVWHFTPPPDSGVANVKDFGAKGDGVTDDTEAIANAISANIGKARYRSNPFIWFPNGTYLVSRPIESRVIAEGRDEGKVFSAGWRPMMILIGETRDGVVIKLKDKADGYSDPSKPKWVIATGSEHENRNNQQGGGNRAFRHNILNLTVDVGAGNPGAIAVDFIANNRGSIDGVTLRAGKDSGHVAINLTRSWPGPAMVHDVAIEGFDHAIKLSHYQYGMTFENIRMSGQRISGIANTDNVVVMRNAEFSGNVPFYQGTGGHGMLCLLGSSLAASDRVGVAAISSGGLLNLRRVKISGFPKVIDDTRKANEDLTGNTNGPTVVKFHDQGFTLNTSGKPAVPLDLPIEEIPTVRPPAGAEWTDGGSDSTSLQAAIDSGAEWIFLKPVQTVKFSDTVVLRNKLRLIMGFHGSVRGPENGKPSFIVGDGDAPVVCIEHVYIDGLIEHPSARTLVLRHCDISELGVPHAGKGKGSFHATGPGKTHVIDVIGRGYKIGPKHKFWARQLNAEFGADPLFTNSGASCILGFKMETSSAGGKNAPLSTPSLLNLGGDLEVVGGLLYTLGSKKKHAPLVPAFTNQSGRLSVSYRTNGKPETLYPIILRKGSFNGGVDLMAKEIKGPGAALLFDER